MSSPKERAEARRKALLSRGGDRLKKLTTSARGEDAPQLVHDDPPLVVPPLNSFIGKSPPDDMQMPTGEWSSEELQRMMAMPPYTEGASSVSPPITTFSTIPSDSQLKRAAPLTTTSPSLSRWIKMAPIAT